MLTKILDITKGAALGAICSTLLVGIGIQGGAFEAHPTTTITDAAVNPTPIPRVNFPFAYRGQHAPRWCAEDMPCWDGSSADGRHWRLLTSALADALAEGEHPERVPSTKITNAGGCYFATSTGDIACMTGFTSRI